MKLFMNAVKDLLAGLLVACFSIPILICCVIVFEILDPFFRFYDTLKYNKDKQTKTNDTW